MSDEKEKLDVRTFDIEQMKALEELKPKLYKFMSENKVKLTDNAERRLRILEGLCNNKVKRDHFLCPCKFVLIGKENELKYNCPCSTAMLDIKKRNECSCGLFVAIKL